MTTLTAFKKDATGDWIEKIAAAIKDYTHNWADWLGVDTIVTSAWAADVGITIDSPAASHDDTTATVWISGGTAGTTYTITNTITTAAGRTEVHEFRVVIK